jgi:hypothetical protein
MSLFEVVPAELIAHILLALDPASFYVCLQTSRRFREHALASTKLLHKQLAHIPGQRVSNPAALASADVLLRTFSRRAAQHLYNGVEQMVDVHIWYAPPSMDRKISTIVRWKELVYPEDDCSPPKESTHNSLLFIEARPPAGTVNIHSMQEGDSMLELKYVISTDAVSEHLPAYDKDGTAEYEVAKVSSVVSGKPRQETGLKLAVLYSPKYPPHDTPNIAMVRNSGLQTILHIHTNAATTIREKTL